MRSNTVCAMRCAAMRFSCERLGVDLPREADRCRGPPAAAGCAVATRSGAWSKCPWAIGLNKLESSDKERCDISAMSKPANDTEIDSRFRRFPPQRLHNVALIKCDTRRFIKVLWVVAKVCST